MSTQRTDPLDSVSTESRVTIIAALTLYAISGANTFDLCITALRELDLEGSARALAATRDKRRETELLAIIDSEREAGRAFGDTADKARRELGLLKHGLAPLPVTE